ncbi:MAG: sigma 54-interacting transcriptional regulator [Myxococcales bacterium]|nr:sigma 54-interacting transcriptional regulator [Myxococcales bacterium]
MSPFEHPRYLPGPELGRGAQAVVLRVTDREAPTRALVAKLWQPGLFEEHLLAGEFALLSRLHVPGLVRAHDLGRDTTTGAQFLVEDFVEGLDAREWVSAASSDRARTERVGRLLGDVTRTLALLHESGFLHGDLKPAHVRVPPTGRATLLDLGAAVARARTAESAVAITHGYAAPELLAGARPTPRSDLYALGALAFSVVTQRAPESTQPVRQLAPWLPPSLGDVIDRLRSAHPADRPGDAREALGMLGQSLVVAQPRAARATRASASERSPREPELLQLAALDPGVHYLVGPAGIGKSHTLDELLTRALLAGRSARLLRFPHTDSELTRALIAWLRGAESARPFAAGSLLLVLDQLAEAPLEVRAAVEAFRCRRRDPNDVSLIAATQSAPPDAPRVVLDALDLDGMHSLCRELGEDVSRAPELLGSSKGNPSFVAAVLGKAALSRGAALEIVHTQSALARRALGSIAVLGGHAPEQLLSFVLGADEARRACAELSRAALARRDVRAGEITYSLAHPEILAELADALGGFDVVDAIANAVLDGDHRPNARELLALAGAPHPPARREQLLMSAARAARGEGLRSEETDALLALAADKKLRTWEVLSALDRATRGGGSAGLHPELIEWLEEAATREPELGVLALRRRAEQRARAGDQEGARTLAERAVELAERRGDHGQLALAMSTVASAALFRADWAGAEVALSRATTTLSAGGVDDAEELCRLDHNRGVVALYRGRLEEARLAFEQSLAAKRALGDRGGTWACLLNLGLCFGQLGRYEQAEQALVEGLATCRALGQISGAGWCLAALADVGVRRGDARAAERHISEAEHLGEGLPKAVHADLALLRAELALLEGDGQRALSEVARVEAELLATDALLHSRSLTLRARAHLATLPAERKLAAKDAIRAARAARTAGLAEPEARALSVLAEARRRLAPVASSEYAPATNMPTDAELWSFLTTASTRTDAGEVALALCRWVAETSGAERVFLLALGDSGVARRGDGVDLDGIAISDVMDRVPSELIESALRAGGIAHHPTVATRGGRGSRLTALSAQRPDHSRALLVLEHRFVPNAFEKLDRSLIERWAVCAALCLALDGARGPHETSSVSAKAPAPAAPRSLPLSSREPSTVLPGRGRRRSFPTIAGDSPGIERALARLDTAVDSELPVLITGETGVGKELFARALHEHGPRAAAPFVAINCGAVPDSLFEAELFGHARGSFTGADRARAGLIARAEGGTLFLDEIGELPLMRQATLLRVLAEKRYRPVGSDEERPFDVRIVTATNRNLEAEVESGGFRRDLLYRLNVLEVRVPALRERREDILPITQQVLEAAGYRGDMAPQAQQALLAYPWPGNVRELEHQLQRVAARGVSRIELEHLAREVRAAFKREPRPKGLPTPSPRVPAGSIGEREEVAQALSAEQGNITRAAARLHLTRHGLKKKMLRLGLREPKASGGSA